MPFTLLSFSSAAAVDGHARILALLLRPDHLPRIIHKICVTYVSMWDGWSHIIKTMYLMKRKAYHSHGERQTGNKQADTLSQRISSYDTRLNTTRIRRYIGRFTSLVVSIVYLSWLLFPASFCFVCLTDSYTAHFFIVNYAHTHTLFNGSFTQRYCHHFCYFCCQQFFPKIFLCRLQWRDKLILPGI